MDTTGTTDFIFLGTLRIAKITNGAVVYFHKDHLGSYTAMTDAAGAKVEGTEYLPYGAMRTHEGSPVSNYKYTDQELDSETGLYNYDARFYDPIIGRFASADTIVPDFTNPQALNRYSYCLNNPVKYVDPSGHILLEAAIGFGFCKVMALGFAYLGFHQAFNLIDRIQGWFGVQKTIENPEEWLSHPQCLRQKLIEQFYSQY